MILHINNNSWTNDTNLWIHSESVVICSVKFSLVPKKSWNLLNIENPLLDGQVFWGFVHANLFANLVLLIDVAPGFGGVLIGEILFALFLPNVSDKYCSLKFGVPAISTDVGGVSGLIKNGRNGITFSIESPASCYANYISQTNRIGQ